MHHFHRLVTHTTKYTLILSNYTLLQLINSFSFGGKKKKKEKKRFYNRESTESWRENEKTFSIDHEILKQIRHKGILKPIPNNSMKKCLTGITD